MRDAAPAEDALRDAARAPKRCQNVTDVSTKIADLETAQRLYLKEYPEEKISPLRAREDPQGDDAG